MGGSEGVETLGRLAACAHLTDLVSDDVLPFAIGQSVSYLELSIEPCCINSCQLAQGSEACRLKFDVMLKSDQILWSSRYRVLWSLSKISYI